MTGLSFVHESSSTAGDWQREKLHTVNHLCLSLTLLCVGAPWACCVHGHCPCRLYLGEVEEDLGGGSSLHNPDGKEAWVPVPLCLRAFGQTHGLHHQICPRAFGTLPLACGHPPSLQTSWWIHHIHMFRHRSWGHRAVHGLLWEPKKVGQREMYWQSRVCRALLQVCKEQVCVY